MVLTLYFIGNSNVFQIFHTVVYVACGMPPFLDPLNGAQVLRRPSLPEMPHQCLT